MAKVIDLHEVQAQFADELRLIIKHKLDEINHYLAGCDSPFTYFQIGEVQEKLSEIAEILGIKQEGKD